MKRSRSNDGHRSRIESTLGVRDGLVMSVLAAEMNRPPERKPDLPASAFSGPKPRKSGAATKDDDWVVLHIRWLHEQAGLSCGSIMSKMAYFGVKLTYSRTKQLCNYSTRAHLVPDSRPGGYAPDQQIGVS